MEAREYPKSIDAERALLGGLLQAPEWIDSVREVVTRESFYLACHGEFFAALLGMATRGDPIDMVTVPETILRHDVSEKCGGVDYVIELSGHCVSTANLLHYAHTVRDKSQLREVAKTLERWTTEAKLETEPWRGWIMTSEVCGLWQWGDPTWPDAANHCHDVYTFDYSERPDRSVDHPTVKPLAVVSDIVGKIAHPGAGVADPFGGSGTTLIACAETGRVARLIELDPKYCDVIRRRWTRWAREHGQDPGPGALEAKADP